MLDTTLLDALAKQLLALREQIDGALYIVTALKQEPKLETKEEALKKIKTFDGIEQLPPT